MALFGPTESKIDRWRQKGRIEKIVDAIDAPAPVGPHALAVYAEIDPGAAIALIEERLGQWPAPLQARVVELYFGSLANVKRIYRHKLDALGILIGAQRDGLIERLLSEAPSMSRGDYVRLLDALIEVEPARTLELLWAVVEDADAMRRHEALRKLAAWEENDEIDRRLFERLLGESGEDAAQALRGQVRSSLRSMLLEALEEANAPTRVKVIGRIADLGWKDLLPRLALLAKKTESDIIRAAAEKAVEAMGGMSREVWGSLLKDPDLEIADEALMTLLRQSDGMFRDRLFAGEEGVGQDRVLTAYWRLIEELRGEATDEAVAWAFAGLGRDPDAYKPVIAWLLPRKHIGMRLFNPAIINAVAQLDPGARRVLDLILIQAGRLDCAEKYYREIDGIDDPSDVLAHLADE